VHSATVFETVNPSGGGRAGKGDICSTKIANPKIANPKIANQRQNIRNSKISEIPKYPKFID
jgi:hypothetical protein